LFRKDSDECDTFSLVSVGKPNAEILVTKGQARPKKSYAVTFVPSHGWGGLMVKSNKSVTDH